MISRVLPICGFICAAAVVASEHDFSDTRDGWPDILWRRRGSDITYGWNVIANQYISNNLIGYSGGDPNWKIAAPAILAGRSKTLS